MPDITSKEDIIYFVDQFYSAVKHDDMIGPIFNHKIGSDDWTKHLQRMYSFWNTVLFGEADYRGNPFSHHISLDIDKRHFDRWISLFTKTVQTHFEGPKADEVLWRAQKMRNMFEAKLREIRSNPNSKPIM